MDLDSVSGQRRKSAALPAIQGCVAVNDAPWISSGHRSRRLSNTTLVDIRAPGSPGWTNSGLTQCAPVGTDSCEHHYGHGQLIGDLNADFNIATGTRPFIALDQNRWGKPGCEANQSSPSDDGDGCHGKLPRNDYGLGSGIAPFGFNDSPTPPRAAGGSMGQPSAPDPGRISQQFKRVRRTVAIRSRTDVTETPAPSDRNPDPLPPDVATGCVRARPRSAIATRRPSSARDHRTAPHRTSSTRCSAC